MVCDGALKELICAESLVVPGPAEFSDGALKNRSLAGSGKLWKR